MKVGLVANPVSARDIRRVIANAACMPIADRANIVLRVMASLGSRGVSTVLMMPENDWANLIILISIKLCSEKYILYISIIHKGTHKSDW